MTLPKNVAELQGENVVFELECIDRMYLNLYVPQLASAPGVAAYFRGCVVFIGIAQEKARVPRTIRKRFGEGEGTIPWIAYTTAMVNHYYFYCVDEDFGPFFIKFCSYFPYTGKLCINGHEYLNGQLARRGIEFEALNSTTDKSVIGDSRCRFV